MKTTKYLTALVLFVCFTFLNSCGSSEEQLAFETVITYNEESNTIFKVYPDGTRHLLQKKELDSDGRIKTEYQYVSRLDRQVGDSAYYFHVLYKRYDYVYDVNGNVSEIVLFADYGNNPEGMVKVSSEQFVYQGDSVVHYNEVYADYARRELLDTRWYDGDRMVKKRIPNGYRDDFVEESWVFDGDMIKRHVFFNFTSDQNHEQYGRTILDYSENRFYLNEEGVPFIDTTYRYSMFDGELDEMSIAEYDIYGNQVKRVFYDVEVIDGEMVINDAYHTAHHDPYPQWMEFSENPNPMEEVLYQLEDRHPTLTNWRNRGEDIYRSEYTYNEHGYIISRKDSIVTQYQNPGDIYSRQINWFYDENNRVTSDLQIISQIGLEVDTLSTVYTYYPSGELQLVSSINSRKEEVLDGTYRVVRHYIELYPQGRRKSFSTVRNYSSGKVDSLYVKILEHKYQEVANVNTVNGELVEGYITMRDDEGRVIRVFDEEGTETDTEYDYNMQGCLIRSTHSKVNFYPMNGLRRWDVYELWYGPGYSKEDVLTTKE